MVKSTLGSSAVAVATLQRGSRPWDVLARSLKSLYNGGANVRWAAYQQDFPQAHKVVPMPSYAWDLKPYWIQYVHDWSLRKGEPAIQQSSAGPRIESTTIHSIVSESGDSKRVQIVVEADIARKDLSPLVQGHEVDGIPLCTPSVYADMALTLGTYLRGRYQPNRPEKAIGVSDMTISKALILNEQSDKQLLQLHAEADWATQSVAMKFVSFKKKTQELQEHARCVVRFQPPTLQRDLQQSSVADAQARIQALREGVVSGATARYSRAMVYRAIRPLARFHDDYRAIDGILLDSGTLEAACRLSFGGVRQNKNDTFHTHPAVLDALTQVCGFAMNCNDGTDLDVEIFMNHGWGSLQLFEPVRFDGRYTTYTRMEPGPDKLWRGDVLVYDDDGGRLVAHLGQIAIQGVPRRVLKVILSLESGRKGQHGAAAAPHSDDTNNKTPEKVSSSPAAHPESVSSRPTPKQTDPALIDVGIQIIAEESGVAVEGFTDDTIFSDMGIDSLLGMTISARFQDQLDFDLDFNGLFFGYPTVKDLKAFLAKSLPGAGPGPSAVDGYTTPEADSSTDGSKTPKTPETPKVLENGDGSNADFTRALQIIAEESGVEAAELGDDTCLADCGVDSLLSLIITSRFRDELDLAVENESLYFEQPTVGDLKRALFGAPENGVEATMPAPPPPVVVPEVETQPLVNGDSNHGKKTNTQQGPNEEARRALLDSRTQAVDKLVETLAEGFSAPTYDNNGPVPDDNQRSSVLATGGTGSLGSHLVYHLAQLDTVKAVVCLNRRNREADAATRQFKAMRDKGIRFPDALKPKLLVLQTDSALPRLGLEPAQYDALAASVTHLVHQAWPMSATRALPGFASEFRVMRNLIDFARDAASAAGRPAGFRFSFEMVSSIGVVGLYGQQQDMSHTPPSVVCVPEASATIDSVLPNGYSEAKWGCERMLEATLHRHPARFRTMTARLGQIAGSKTSGYWNPMEHFGFLVKSSCTLGALPDVDGKLYWTPVNDVAATLADLVLADGDPCPFYHVNNLVGQPWPETTRFLQAALRIPRLVPFADWLARVREAPQRGNPASILSEFLESNYLRMSCGGLVLDVSNTLKHSSTLRGVGPVPQEILGKYIHIWKEIGFL
ncbi:Acyl transferase/acyl hydrolase/lysophospholipase [Apiospora aurea]|uniref:Acyl transferase/acyl hydrolase/lysophospholipase n=1 Tax=Apiospora aurea TaxID=335848 RepID=A0ABR1QKN9_9PEZI